jgi:hypothetical protein
MTKGKGLLICVLVVALIVMFAIQEFQPSLFDSLGNFFTIFALLTLIILLAGRKVKH